MIRAFLEELNKSYECKSVDVGDFAEVRVEGSKIHIEAYDAEGLGRVALIEVKGFLNLWYMHSFIVNPMSKDAPIYYYHRHNRKGKDIYKVEVLDTLLEERVFDEFDTVLEKYAEIEELKDKENWYDEIKMRGTVLKGIKKVEKAVLDEMSEEHFSAYLRILENAPACGQTRKKAQMQEFIDGLVEWSGIAILQLFRSYYEKKVATKLCTDILFGIK